MKERKKMTCGRIRSGRGGVANDGRGGGVSGAEGVLRRRERGKRRDDDVVGSGGGRNNGARGSS